MYQKLENISPLSRIEDGVDKGRVEDAKLAESLASFEDKERENVILDALLIKAINFAYATDPTAQKFDIKSICYTALENPSIMQDLREIGAKEFPQANDYVMASNTAQYSLADRFKQIIENNKELSEIAIPASDGYVYIRNEDIARAAAIIEQGIMSIDDIHQAEESMLDKRDNAVKKLGDLGVETVRARH